MLDWKKLLNDERFGDSPKRSEPVGKPEPPDFAKGQFRLEKERDHDRILFSTPFRRMGDKTQVFPLESIESIHTRLTHSIEVANLARSIGIRIAVELDDKLPKDAMRIIPATLAATGLAHDIGNPPFGHQGERAIRDWFERNKNIFVERSRKKGEQLTKQHTNDFLEFDGNAQTLRVLTKLQVIGDDLGLNLTLGTLSSMMKYVVASNKLDSNTPSKKKVGFFASEQSLVREVREKTGLRGHARHPLAIIMESCDDIAYSVIDAEDAIKKDIVSFNDLIFSLESGESDYVIKDLCEHARWKHKSLDRQALHPKELQDIATQMFRVYAIHLMVSAVEVAFRDNYDEIMEGKFDRELIEASEASKLCAALKKFDWEYAFNHKTVLAIEANGYNVINQLMDFFWIGISHRKDY